MLIRDQAGRTARLALQSGLGWLIVAFAAGLAAALSAAGLAGGPIHRLQPIFLNTLLFGWFALGGAGVGLLIIQRTLGAVLYSEPLGQVSVWLWNAANATGVAALLLDRWSPGPFPGYIWPAQLAWLLALLLFLLNTTRTLGTVREPFFIGTGYFLAALTWGGAVYFLGNGLWRPDGLGAGAAPALLQGMYAVSVVWLWAVPLALGTALYVAAAASGRPLYSRKLAQLGLWGLALHAATGVQRLWGAPVPAWAQAVSTAAAVLTLVPLLAFAVNVNETLGRGPHAAAVQARPPGRLLRFGLWLALAGGVAAALQTLSLVQRYVYGTQWSVAPWLAALFGATLLQLAGVYELLPLLRPPKDRPGEPLYGERAARAHVALSAGGAALFVLGVVLSGSLQVAARLSQGANAGLAAAAAPGLAAQAAGLALFLAGQVVLGAIVARAAAVREPARLPVVVTNPRPRPSTERHGHPVG